MGGTGVYGADLATHIHVFLERPDQKQKYDLESPWVYSSHY